MSRRNLATAFSVVLTALMIPSIHADDRGNYQNAAPPLLIPPLMDQPTAMPPTAPYVGSYQPASVPAALASDRARLVSNQSAMGPTPIDANRAQGSAGPAVMAPEPQGYVRLGAPMYPTPRPNIPIWSGSTVITNQAFAPQEMLYPHTYRAIYPPYYHRVKGGWILTPLGVRSHEKWELQGTKVQVSYRSSYPGLLSGACWHPHVAQTHGGYWR